MEVDGAVVFWGWCFFWGWFGVSMALRKRPADNWAMLVQLIRAIVREV